MKNAPGTETAAICGLFCGTCPSYPEECLGCLSDKVAAGCDLCSNGFRDCASSNDITRCYECTNFPCERLEDFSKRHIVNGICHHAHVIEDLKSMKEIGLDEWVEAQTKTHTCPNCQKLMPWYSKGCPNPGCR